MKTARSAANCATELGCLFAGRSHGTEHSPCEAVGLRGAPSARSKSIAGPVGGVVGGVGDGAGELAPEDQEEAEAGNGEAHERAGDGGLLGAEAGLAEAVEAHGEDAAADEDGEPAAEGDEAGDGVGGGGVLVHGQAASAVGYRAGYWPLRRWWRSSGAGAPVMGRPWAVW